MGSEEVIGQAAYKEEQEHNGRDDDRRVGAITPGFSAVVTLGFGA
jgi:hypothetical protein